MNVRGTPVTGRRLLLLGANGPTGREVVRQALDLGHEVHALTRHPGAFPLRHDRLDVITGDATDRDVIDDAVARADAVAPRPRRGGRPG